MMTRKTDRKTPTKRKLVAQVAGPVDIRRRKRGLTRAIKTAVDAMMFDRCTRADACKRADITERALYLALAKPEVAAYWNGQLHVLRTGERASNILRLAELRDQDVSRSAAVKAIQVLEQLDASTEQRPMGLASRPDITIIISPPNMGANVGIGPLIDITPRENTGE